MNTKAKTTEQLPLCTKISRKRKAEEVKNMFLKCRSCKMSVPLFVKTSGWGTKKCLVLKKEFMTFFVLQDPEEAMACAKKRQHYRIEVKSFHLHLKFCIFSYVSL
jgi:hypothetical protein